MDIFYEQNVVNPNIDKHNKRTRVFSVLRTVFLIIGIVLILLLGGSITSPFTVPKVIIGFAIAILSGVPFILAYILLTKFLRNSNSEYDYILNNGSMKIVRVILRNKRKLAFTVRLDAVEAVGRITCEAYERLAASKDLKKQFAVCDYSDENSIVYVLYRSEGENFLLHIMPDEQMVSAMRRSLPRMGIMDKSMNMAVPEIKK